MSPPPDGVPPRGWLQRLMWDWVVPVGAMVGVLWALNAFAGALLGGMLVGLLLDEADAPTFEPLRPADYRPVLRTLDGEEVPMASLRGETVFLNVWAPWCAPCVAEMPSLQALHEATEGEVRFAVVTSSDERARAARFRWVHGHTMPFYVIDHALPQDAYPTRSIPASFVISPAGLVVWEARGAATYGEAFAEALTAL